jgi:protein-S-isoprenylcysteine O-methyltransferase Ste14
MFKEMKSMKKSRSYHVLVVLAILFAVLTFTPLVMPYGKHQPTFLHLPYTLWTGLLVAILFVCLTWLAVRLHPGKGEDES